MLFAGATPSSPECSATHTPLSDSIMREKMQGSCIKLCGNVVRLRELENRFCSQVSPVMQNKVGVCSPRLNNSRSFLRWRYSELVQDASARPAAGLTLGAL